MAENSAISWTDDTFNPWIGCTKVSPACDGCYAEAMMAGRYGRVEWGGPGKGDGTRSRTAASTWKLPRKWNREQEAYEHNCSLIGETPEPRFVFCASLADVFDNAVPAEWRRDLFDLIRATPNLTWLLLTKRPGNIVKLWHETVTLHMDEPPDEVERWPLNAAIGCTVANQDEADRDIPKLLRAKAALRPAFAFLSMEPLLGPVDLTDVANDGDSYWDALTGHPAEETIDGEPCEKVDWVITGGETDQGAHKARPSRPDWFRSLRDQCAAAEVPFHFKQWGEWREAQEGDEFNTSMGRAGKPPAFIVDPADATVHCFLPAHPNPRCRAMLRVGSKAAGRRLDGVTHDARPEVRR